MQREITGAQLKVWRDQHNKTLEEVGQLLGGVTGPTISRWEGGQGIPGPSQILLGILMFGDQPYTSDDNAAAVEERKHFWQLKMTLEDWHKLEGLSSAAGFATVRDYLLTLIQAELYRDQKA